MKNTIVIAILSLTLWHNNATANTQPNENAPIEVKLDNSWNSFWTKFKTALANGDKEALIGVIHDKGQVEYLTGQIDYLLARPAVVREYVSLQGYDNFMCVKYENISKDAAKRICMITEDSEDYHLSFGMYNGQYYWLYGAAN